MLNVEMNKGIITKLEVSGSVRDMLADICIVICEVHKNLDRQDSNAGEFYKMGLKKAVEEEACFYDGLFADAFKKDEEKQTKVDSTLSKVIEKMNKGEISDDDIEVIAKRLAKAVEDFA